MASGAKLIISSDTKGAETGVKSVQGLFQGLAKDAKASVLTGVGLGAGVSAFGAVAGAARSAVGYLFEAAAAAREDEVSVGRLTTSLKANVPGWDGSTAAIDRRIAAGMKLAFTDEEQRNSLALLVAATNDVAAAQEIQSTAMDLARLKEISLEAASEALIKVEGGRFRLLQGLGIQLRDGATATEALAAVQKIAAGQAVKFGNESAGAAEGAAMAFDELKEEIGRELLPVMTDLAKFARDDMVPALKSSIPVVKELAGDAIPLLATALSVKLVGAITGVKVALLPLVGLFEASTLKMGDDAKELEDSARESFFGMLNDLSGLPPATDASLKGMAAAFAGARGPIRDQAAGIGSDLTTALAEAGAMSAEIALAIPGDIAKALRDGRQDWQTALTTLGEDVKDATTTAARIAELNAALIDPALVAGLASGDPLVKAQAQATRALIVEQLKIENAYSWGEKIALTWAAGIASSTALAAAGRAALALKDVVTGPLQFEGSPPYTHSREIGRKVAESWGEGLGSGFSGLKMPTLPGISGGDRLAMAGSGGGGGGSSVVEIHLHNYMDGKEVADIVSRHQYYSASGSSRFPRG